VSALAQILTISGECLGASDGCADLQPSGWLAPKGYVSGIAADGRIVVIGRDSKKPFCRIS